MVLTVALVKMVPQDMTEDLVFPERLAHRERRDLMDLLDILVFLEPL